MSATVSASILLHECFSIGKWCELEAIATVALAMVADRIGFDDGDSGSGAGDGDNAYTNGVQNGDNNGLKSLC